eukprot:6530725-Pyramimonas_sp.AAC.1
MGPCVLGCSETALDSVEHYCQCPVLRHWQRRQLGFQITQHGLAHSVLGATMDDTTLMLQATSTYVLYRTVHHIRHLRDQPRRDRQQYVQHYMGQTLHEACRGCARLRN